MGRRKNIPNLINLKSRAHHDAPPTQSANGLGGK
jgi:hypothetical protein